MADLVNLRPIYTLRRTLPLSGKPVVRGTRIHVYLIANFVETGHTPAEIVAAYPVLTEADIAAAVAYAQQERERTEVRPW